MTDDQLGEDAGDENSEEAALERAMAYLNSLPPEEVKRLLRESGTVDDALTGMAELAMSAKDPQIRAEAAQIIDTGSSLMAGSVVLAVSRCARRAPHALGGRCTGRSEGSSWPARTVRRSSSTSIGRVSGHRTDSRR